VLKIWNRRNSRSDREVSEKYGPLAASSVQCKQRARPRLISKSPAHSVRCAA